MDNLFQIISTINQQMNQFVMDALEIEGYKNMYVSHGKILINFMDEEVFNFKELSARINKSPQTMTTLIRKLEKDGLISFTKDPKDKRNKLVSITNEGRKFIPIMKKISKELYDIQYKNISSEQQKQLREVLTVLSRNFEE